MHADCWVRRMHNRMVLSLLMIAVSGHAQDSVTFGWELFGQHCAACHGADARGTGRALDTAGGVLFCGDPYGDFAAVDEKDGRLLWHFMTNEVIKASPITYTVDGRQFVALAVGSNIMSFGLPWSTRSRSGRGQRISFE